MIHQAHFAVSHSAASGLQGLTPDPGAKRVLVVDDEEYITEVLSRWLIDRGYECYCCRTVDDALALLAKSPFGLVLTDVMMPKKTGIDLLHELHARFPTTAVILVTGLDDQRLAQEAANTGAYGFLLKPIKYNELIVSVASALSARRFKLEATTYQQHLEAEVQNRCLTIERLDEEMAWRLVNALELRDIETGTHIRRIGLYSAALARALGWKHKNVLALELAAMLHDVGKIGIPDEILHKPGKLTEAEFEIMKTHAEAGARILHDSKSPVLQLAAEIAYSHHERWDGHGYPQKLARREIPEAARIVAVADVYDALSTARPYKDAWPEDKVIATLMTERGKHFDPTLVEVFLECLPVIHRIHDDFDDPSAANEKRLISVDLYFAEHSDGHKVRHGTLSR